MCSSYSFTITIRQDWMYHSSWNPPATKEQYLLWHKGEHRHVTHKATCLGGKEWKRTPNLAALPPTHEAFIENVKRAHFQAMLWRNLYVNLLPALNPEEFGWKKDTCNRSLIPTHLPEDAKLVPDYILEMIRCGCKSETPCNSKKCSCK
ncbi:hypothetical protein F7725_022379, partial [Dissostichus mawsoni]